MKTMPKNTQEERFKWLQPIPNNSLSTKQMSQIYPSSEKILKDWLDSYRQQGFIGIAPKSRCPKPQQGDPPHQNQGKNH